MWVNYEYTHCMYEHAQRRVDMLVGKTQECNNYFFSQGQGEQHQAATSGLCKGQRSVIVARAELANSYQVYLNLPH